jgi:hypothetical protein
MLLILRFCGGGCRSRRRWNPPWQEPRPHLPPMLISTDGLSFALAYGVYGRLGFVYGDYAAVALIM